LTEIKEGTSKFLMTEWAYSRTAFGYPDTSVIRYGLTQQLEVRYESLTDHPNEVNRTLFNHGGKVNYVYADGHVSTLDAKNYKGRDIPLGPEFIGTGTNASFSPVSNSFPGGPWLRFKKGVQ
jgi:prepilin-type processing-associated H-X9-DG protein